MDACLRCQPHIRKNIRITSTSVDRRRTHGADSAMGKEVVDADRSLLSHFCFHTYRTASVGMERWRRNRLVVGDLYHSRRSSKFTTTCLTHFMGGCRLLSWARFNLPPRSCARTRLGSCVGIVEAFTPHRVAMHYRICCWFDFGLDSSVPGRPICNDSRSFA